ncbi:MAG: SpoIIE family protein phosphatase, partial [Candidatus Rifleibacteriota bacterium]
LLCWFVLSFKQQEYRNELFAKAEKLLENFHAEFSFKNALDSQVKSLLRNIVNTTPKQAAEIFSEWKKDNLIPSDAAELVLFRNGKPLGNLKHAADWQLLLENLDIGQHPLRRSITPKKNRIIKLLHGGVGFETLRAKPLSLQKLNRGPETSYAAWYKAESLNDKTVAVSAAIFLLHKGKFPANFLANHQLRKNKIDAGTISYVDLFNPSFSIINSHYLNAFDLAALVKTFAIKNQSTLINFEGHEILLSVKPDGRILVFAPDNLEVPMPLWVWALPFFWLPLVGYYFLINRSTGILSLKNLVAGISFVGIILPATMVAVYWSFFLETQRETLKIEYAKLLESYLFQVDSSHKVQLRKNKYRFKNIFEIFDGSQDSLQKFINETVRLEIAMIVDTTLLVNNKGKFVRPSSSSTSRTRGLVFFPMEYRKEVIKQYLKLGWVPLSEEISFALQPKEASLNEYCSFTSKRSKVVLSSLGKMAGRDIVDSYNLEHGFSVSKRKKNVSEIVLGTFAEDSDVNPVQIIGQNLGDYVEFGFGRYQSRNFVDVLTDTSGKALYCAILYGMASLSINQYFDSLFAKPEEWPQSVKYFAISGLPLRLSYPWLDTWQRMESLLRMLKPPRNILVDEVYINGEKNLRCAFVGRSCRDYILIACMPIKVIDKAVNKYRNFILAGLSLLFFLLISVYLKLKTNIINPSNEIMQGVRALKERDHNARIKIKTSDEWEKLGNTFNTALEGIKELEVANFVQTSILPAEETITRNCAFLGKTQSAEEIGGDYYDNFVCAEGLVFIMGDVSGHSISAALVVNMAKAAFCALHDSGLRSPDQILQSMNDFLLEHLKRIKMMTCFSGLITPDGELLYSNAGQSYPFLLSKNETSCLKQIGYPLGSTGKGKFKLSRIKLPQKCRIVMFSDGLIEAADENGQQFGYDRLETMVNKLGLDIYRSEFIEKAYKELKAFTGTVPWDDDVTLAIVDYEKND